METVSPANSRPVGKSGTRKRLQALVGKPQRLQRQPRETGLKGRRGAMAEELFSRLHAKRSPGRRRTPQQASLEAVQAKSKNRLTGFLHVRWLQFSRRSERQLPIAQNGSWEGNCRRSAAGHGRELARSKRASASGRFRRYSERPVLRRAMNVAKWRYLLVQVAATVDCERPWQPCETSAHQNHHLFSLSVVRLYQPKTATVDLMVMPPSGLRRI